MRSTPKSTGPNGPWSATTADTNDIWCAVGHLVSKVAQAEVDLHHAFAILLEMDFIQALTITEKLSPDNIISLLKYHFEQRWPERTKDLAEFKKVLDEIQKIRADRNIVAHQVMNFSDTELKYSNAFFNWTKAKENFTSVEELHEAARRIGQLSFPLHDLLDPDHEAKRKAREDAFAEHCIEIGLPDPRLQKK